MKNKNTATLLAIFTGIIGGHRFYLGQFGLGMLYLVSSWTFVPLFLGILDALVFLFQSDERFNEKYNGGTSATSQNAASFKIEAEVGKPRGKNEFTEMYVGLLDELAADALKLIDQLDADKALETKLKEVDQSKTSKREHIRLFMMNDMMHITRMTVEQVKRKRDPKIMGGFLVIQRIMADQKEFYLDYPVSDLNIFLNKTDYLQRPIDIIWDLDNPLTIGFGVGDDPVTDVRSGFALLPLLQLIQSDLLIPAATLMHRMALVLFKHDVTVSKKEERLLKEIYEVTHNPVPAFAERTKGNVKTTEAKDNKNLEQALEELHSLIGLEDVKEEIQTLVNFVKIQQQREKEGLKTNQISYHIVFTGNPGTGKTTVARLLAQIYRELGLIEKGHLVETDRSGMIAEYAGQTAVKVNKVIDEALDGVLFIDEAYALVGQNKDDYGKEAVATLIKRMEDDRKRLIVVLAGYSNEMNDFIETNPGFKSRINRYIDFKDYSAEEMLGIFKLFLKQSQYNLSQEAESVTRGIFENAYSKRDKSFGNGRFVRNVFEKCLEKQANRLAKLGNIDRKVLMKIEAEDIGLD